MAEKHYKYLNFLTGMFVTLLLLSSLLSSAKIIDLGTSLGPIPLIFDGVLRVVNWATAGETLWQQNAGDDAYNAILGGVSGLIVASIAAYFMGAFTNSYVLARMKILTKRHPLAQESRKRRRLRLRNPFQPIQTR